MKEFYIPWFLSIFKRKQKELSCPYDLLVIFASGDNRLKWKEREISLFFWAAKWLFFRLKIDKNLGTELKVENLEKVFNSITKNIFSSFLCYFCKAQKRSKQYKDSVTGYVLWLPCIQKLSLALTQPPSYYYFSLAFWIYYLWN